MNTLVALICGLVSGQRAQLSTIADHAPRGTADQEYVIAGFRRWLKADVPTVDGWFLPVAVALVAKLASSRSCWCWMAVALGVAVALGCSGSSIRAVTAVAAKAELMVNGQVVEQGQVHVDWLSGGETERGVFVFTNDPASGELKLSVGSYRIPGAYCRVFPGSPPLYFRTTGSACVLLSSRGHGARHTLRSAMLPDGTKMPDDQDFPDGWKEPCHRSSGLSGAPSALLRGVAPCCIRDPPRRMRMIHAYVFIHISAADPLEVLTVLRQIPQVKPAQIVLGPIDGIACIECTNQEELQQTIVEIRWVNGVINTDTRYVYAGSAEAYRSE